LAFFYSWPVDVLKNLDFSFFDCVIYVESLNLCDGALFFSGHHQPQGNSS
jgi:hypothetical protein